MLLAVRVPESARKVPESERGTLAPAQTMEVFTFRENSIVVTIPLQRIKKIGNKVGNKKD